jgi:ATP-dependent Clp protease protease subunit
MRNRKRDRIDPRALKAQEPDVPEPEEPEEPEEKGRPQRIGRIAYDLLKKERTVLISEEVSPKLTERVMGQLLWLDAQSHEPIRIFINTPGGSADDGFGIFDLIRFIRSPVTNICVGLNASAGTIILLGVPKERRLALPNARIMIHQPSGGARGRATDIEISADEILKLRQRANELIAEECGRKLEQVEQDTDRDRWMSPEEARDYGLISRIISTVKDI